MPKVTIGLPVYNGAKYLDIALSSLCAQTYDDLEIFISDNASTDETPKIIKKWIKIDPRINYIRQEKTMPVQEHFEWVVNYVQSKWFCYAAHDDMWSSNYILELMGAIDKSNKSLISVSNRTLVDSDGNEIRTHFYVENIGGKRLIDKVRHNFKIVQSSWFYGIYDRKTLIKLQKSDVYFKHVWGCDFARFLPFLFSDSIVGSKEAVFYQRDTGLSDQRYRPKTANDKYQHYYDFWREMLFYLNKSGLSLLGKISLIPVLFHYASRVVKPRRIVKSYIKEIFDKK